MTPAATGALLGLVGGSALVYTIGRTPLLRRQTLADRIEPYLREAGAGLDRRPRHSGEGPLATLTRPLLDAAARLDRFLGGREALQRRLERAGGRRTLPEFRTRQVLAAVLGALVGAALLALRV